MQGARTASAVFSRAAVALHGSRSARHNHSDSISRRTADEARSASWESKQSSAAASIVATRYVGQPHIGWRGCRAPRPATCSISTGRCRAVGLVQGAGPPPPRPHPWRPDTPLALALSPWMHLGRLWIATVIEGLRLDISSKMDEKNGSVTADAGEAARAAQPAPGGLAAAPPTATRAGGLSILCQFFRR